MLKLHEFIFKIGQTRRNPSLFKYYGELIHSQNFSIEALQQLQQKRLSKLLNFAYQNSPYYRELFQNANFLPQEKHGIEDLQKLPISFKRDLIQNNANVQVNLSLFKKSFLCESSGSSGEILTFYRDENWDSFNRASQMRGYSWHNVKPWEHNLYFWGYNKNRSKRFKIKFLDYLVNRVRIFDYEDLMKNGEIAGFDNLAYIEGYSSMIYEFAQLLEAKNISLKGVKMVKGTSEMLYPHYQPVCQKVFGRKMINEYGAAESGIIGFECAHGNMHVNLEGVILESDEEYGILVTNLLSYSFPIIRYSLGDHIKLKSADYHCPCGMVHPVIEEVNGRIGLNILGREKKYPSMTLYSIFKSLFFNEGIRLDYQAHQFKRGELEIWFKEEQSERVLELVRKEFFGYFKDISLTFKTNSDFRIQKGKLKDFISHL